MVALLPLKVLKISRFKLSAPNDLHFKKCITHGIEVKTSCYPMARLD